MPVLDEVLDANEQYASSFGSKAELALPPAGRFAILTCMGARLDPAKYAGLSEDVARIRSHPLVPGRIPVNGYIYDVRTGRLVEVPKATAAGEAI